MFENRKHAFWQAFFLTILFLALGLVLGVYLEQIRGDKLSLTYSQSEISLYDSFALTKLAESKLVSCADLKIATIDFADKIYYEALQLEKIDEKSKLTETVKSLHRKYDLLRTMLWINVKDVRAKCNNFESVVYLYDYETEDVNVKSKAIVWERILSDLKTQRGDDIILIPIAADSDLASLNSLIKPLNITEYPVVIINDKYLIKKIDTVSDLDKYL